MRSKLTAITSALRRLLRKPLFYVGLGLALIIGAFARDLYLAHIAIQRNADNLVGVHLALEGYLDATSRAKANEVPAVHDEYLRPLTATSQDFKSKFLILPWGRNKQKQVLQCREIGESAMSLARRDHEFRQLLVEYDKARLKVTDTVAESRKTTEFTPYREARMRMQAFNAAITEFSKVLEKLNALYDKNKLGKHHSAQLTSIYSIMVAGEQLVQTYLSLERGDESSANLHLDNVDIALDISEALNKEIPEEVKAVDLVWDEKVFGVIAKKNYELDSCINELLD